jgi:putative MFS transporter
MRDAEGAAITARLDRLPVTRYVWSLVLLLSLGGAFEFYDLFMTAYLTPGLVRSGIFHGHEHGLFGLSDQATFAAATFAGLFLGTILFAQVADRAGRRAVFTGSLLWYTVATLLMATRDSAVGVDVWRCIAGIGIGVELVTIDTYITELMPARARGRAFAANQSVQFTAVPVVALLCWLLVPLDPFGVAGWRVVVVLGAAAAVGVWVIRRLVPESPRGLIQRGRLAEAEAVTGRMEARVAADCGGRLPPPGPAVAETTHRGRFSEIFRPPYGGRTLMLSVFNFFQTIGFYGFGNWVATLLAAQGASVTKSLLYSFVIAIAYPVGPLICLTFADRFERKWQIVAAAIGTAAFGLAFSQMTAAAGLIAFGVLITLSNNLLSYAYHGYQAELFPTRIRAQAVGFVYAWSRASTILTSFMIGFVLRDFGATGVFVFIAASMGVVVASIGGFGPRTRGLALEEISR